MNNAEPAADAAIATAPAPLWKRSLKNPWVWAVLVGSCLIHTAGYALVQTTRPRPSERPTAEYTIGDFVFRSPLTNEPEVQAASFTLHVHLLVPQDPSVRQTLVDHRLRLRQAVEQLLRQAHGQDFMDTQLEELRRQLVAQINQTLGAKTIDSVIITNLELQRPDAIFAAPKSAPTSPELDTASHMDSAPRSASTSPVSPILSRVVGEMASSLGN